MAQAAEGERLSSVDDLDVVVDTDAHVTDTVDLIEPYIDDRYEGIRRTVQKEDYPLRNIYTLSHALPVFPQSEYSNSRKLFGEDAVSGDKHAKMRENEEFGIDYGILNPTLSMGISSVQNTRFAVALMEAYNSWLLDEFLDEDESLKGTVVVAPQRPSKAAEEIDRRASEKDIVGVAVPSMGITEPLGHHRYDPIYEAAQDNDLPIVLHANTGALAQTFPVQAKSNETYTEDHLIGHPFSLTWNLTSMMFQGVPERYPDLKFNLQEGGIAWVPYVVWRMDDHHMSLADENPYLERPPSEYLKDRFYFSTQPLGHTTNHKHLAWAIEMTGPELVMYSSDLPHPDFDPPEELFDRICTHLDADAVRGIMGETALDVFDL